MPLSEAVIQDFDRLSRRQVVRNIEDWAVNPDPAPAVIESPVYRKEVEIGITDDVDFSTDRFQFFANNF